MVRGRPRSDRSLTHTAMPIESITNMPQLFRFPAVLTALALTLCLSPGSLHAEGELVDGIAAVVNDDVITFSQVRDVVAARERMLRSTLRGQELVDQIKEARLGALKDLIDRQLIIQKFEEDELSIPDRIIEQRIDQLVREEFGGDREAFLRTLQAQGFTLSKFKEVEREKIIVQAMRARHVQTNVLISPQKIEAYYQRNSKDYATPEQVKLRLIKIAKNAEGGEDDGETQRAIAEEIRSKLASGADFERMAQMYSDDSTREVGGDWGWIDRNTLNEELTDEIFKLKAGEISPVVELGDFYYILMVEARKNATTRPLSEVRSEIEDKLLQEERLENQQKWIDSLREKAYIKIY